VHNRFLSLVFLLTRKTVEFYIAPTAVDSTPTFMFAHEPLAIPEISVLRNLSLTPGTEPPDSPELGRVTHGDTSPPSMRLFCETSDSTGVLAPRSPGESCRFSDSKRQRCKRRYLSKSIQTRFQTLASLSLRQQKRGKSPQSSNAADSRFLCSGQSS